MKNVVDLLKEKFGDLLASMSFGNGHVYFTLSDDYFQSTHSMRISGDTDEIVKGRLNMIYNDFIKDSLKEQKAEQDSEILNKYLTRFDDDLSIGDMKQVVEFCTKQGIDLYYQYGFLGILYNFRLTDKSIIAYDSVNNKIVFNRHSNKDYMFCKQAIQVSSY